MTRSVADLRLRPSAADTWLRCEAQPVALRQLMDNATIVEGGDSSHAERGRNIHAWAAAHLQHALGIGTALDHTALPAFPGGDDVEEELVREYYVSPIIDIALTHAPERFGVETEVLLWYNNRKGFIDYWWYNVETRTLHVWDLKAGYGVHVSPTTYQLRIYALALLLTRLPDLEIDWINLLISQPMQPNPIRATKVTKLALLQFQRLINESVSRIVNEDQLNFVAGEEQCFWCPVKPFCPEVKKLAVRAAQEVFSGDVEVFAGGALPSIDVMIEGARDLAVVELWVKAMYKAVINQLALAPETLPGWTREKGRPGPRKWEDTSKALEMLRFLDVDEANYLKPALMTPTQTQKTLSDNSEVWGALQPLITREEGSWKITPVNDPRPSLLQRNAATNVFDAITDGEEEVDPFAAD